MTLGLHHYLIDYDEQTEDVKAYMRSRVIECTCCCSKILPRHISDDCRYIESRHETAFFCSTKCALSYYTCSIHPPGGFLEKSQEWISLLERFGRDITNQDILEQI